MKQIVANILIITSLVAIAAMPAQAQSEKKAVRRGNKAFEKQDFVEAEVQYREALEQNAHSIKGQYNLAASLYKQEKFEEATTANGEVNTTGLDNQQHANLLYNKGNALFKQEKYKESVAAYKQAIKLNPNDMQARYNLSEAMRMLQQQESNNGGGQQNQDNQDNQDKQESDSQNDQNQGDNNQNKPDNDQDSQDKQDKNKENQDNQDDQKPPQDKQQQQQQQPKISKADAERMLEALQQNDKDLQDKMNAQRRKAATAKPLKNW